MHGMVLNEPCLNDQQVMKQEGSKQRQPRCFYHMIIVPLCLSGEPWFMDVLRPPSSKKNISGARLQVRSGAK